MRRMKISPKNEKGQILVIVAVSMFVLLVVIGLAIDSTLLYLNYARLKRAVDAGAIAAANDFKLNSSLTRMKEAALEVLNLNDINTAAVDIKIYMCDLDGDGVRDATLQTLVPDFYAKCPKTANDSPRKMIYIRASERSQTYFVSLLGIQNIPISTTAIAEAAPVDLVIVLDTSSSMREYDPNDPACSPNCKQPLAAAKEAAQVLINNLYSGYDRVAVVTFDTVAITRYSFIDANTGKLAGAASAAGASSLQPRVDPPGYRLFWRNKDGGLIGAVNPIDPEDRDNNGSDDDSTTASTQCTLDTPDNPARPRWDSTKGIPCDAADVKDAFDWNDPLNYIFNGSAGDTCPGTISDNCGSQNWMRLNDPFIPAHNPHPPMTLVSTCSGCGMREATANLLTGGRSNAVWVIVFLSDGVANMTDTPATYPYVASTGLGIPAGYPNGYCGGKLDFNLTDNDDNATATLHKLNFNYWDTMCIDAYPEERWCINSDPETCPLSTKLAGTRTSALSPALTKISPPYSAEDYAKDMTDRSALRSSTNSKEKLGNDIAIYTVAFGDNAIQGAPLLRYMAAVGDDGNRETDPCSPAGVTKPAKESCGQYYFAQTTQDLIPIFQDISSRIYTKIAE
jgi:hypothetical protein